MIQGLKTVKSVELLDQFLFVLPTAAVSHEAMWLFCVVIYTSAELSSFTNGENVKPPTTSLKHMVQSKKICCTAPEISF